MLSDISDHLPILTLVKKTKHQYKWSFGIQNMKPKQEKDKWDTKYIVYHWLD